MRSVWMLLLGILLGLVMMGVFGLSWLVGPTVEPVSAYCRGFAEGWSHAFQLNASQAPLSQVDTDTVEASCMSDRLFIGEGWLWRGPLLPSP